MMAYGITHCPKCFSLYVNGECNCTREQKRINQEKLNLLLDMTIEEIASLKILAKEKLENQLEE